jgi:hypothetical protein
MLAFEAGGEKIPQIHFAKPFHRRAKTTKAYSFPWISLSCSPSSACTSLVRANYPNSYLYPSSVLKYMRRDAEPSYIPSLVLFSILSILSLVGAIGLSVRGASRNGKGLCEDFASEHPEKCTNAAIVMGIAWISVIIGTPSVSLSSYLYPLTLFSAFAGLLVSWLDRSLRMTRANNPDGWQRPVKELELPKQYLQPKSSFPSSRLYVIGPTASYIPRPRDPYDTPRRRRSTRSQPHQMNPQRVPSNRAPIPPLPPLPSFHPLELEPDMVAARRINRVQGNRARSDQRAYKDLPELPPPTRRPLEDPHKREMQRMRHLSPTDLYAQLGG